MSIAGPSKSVTVQKDPVSDTWLPIVYPPPILPLPIWVEKVTHIFAAWHVFIMEMHEQGIRNGTRDRPILDFQKLTSLNGLCFTFEDFSKVCGVHLHAMVIESPAELQREMGRAENVAIEFAVLVLYRRLLWLRHQKGLEPLWCRVMTREQFSNPVFKNAVKAARTGNFELSHETHLYEPRKILPSLEHGSNNVTNHRESGHSHPPREWRPF